MAWDFVSFFSGLICGSAGTVILMYRDWQEVKRKGREFERRLCAIEEAQNKAAETNTARQRSSADRAGVQFVPRV